MTHEEMMGMIAMKSVPVDYDGYPGVSADDGWWRGTLFGAGGTELTIGQWTSPNNRIFVRFPGVTIPQGATINSAYCRFTARYSYAGVTCQNNIYMNDEDTAVAPTTYTEANALAKTAAVPWTVPPWTAGTQYDTPDLATIIQAVINRAGWSSGNALMIIIWDDGSDTYGARDISAIDYDSGSEQPELHINYTV